MLMPKNNRRRIYEKLNYFQKNLSYLEKSIKTKDEKKINFSLDRLFENFRDLRVLIYVFLTKTSFKTENNFKSFFLNKRFEKNLFSKLVKNKNLNILDKFFLIRLNNLVEKKFSNNKSRAKVSKKLLKYFDKFNILIIKICEIEHKKL